MLMVPFPSKLFRGARQDIGEDYAGRQVRQVDGKHDPYYLCLEILLNRMSRLNLCRLDSGVRPG